MRPQKLDHVVEPLAVTCLYEAAVRSRTQVSRKLAF
jgi:hypothetical protein